MCLAIEVVSEVRSEKTGDEAEQQAEIRRLLEAPDGKGRIALTYACREGHEELVGYLLSLSGDQSHVDHADSDKLTPLAWAVLRRHSAVVGHLLNAGATVDDASWSQEPAQIDINHPLFYLSALQNDVGTAKLLLEYHSTRSTHQDLQHTVSLTLFESAKLGHANMFNLLLGSAHLADEHGGQFREKCTQDATRDAFACYHWELARRTARANPELFVGNACVFCHEIVAGGGRQFGELLSIAHADVDSFGRFGYSLFLCAIYNLRRTAQRLLKAGASREERFYNEKSKCIRLLRCFERLTPAEAARKRGFNELAQFIDDFEPSLQDLCLRRVRRSLPSPLYDSAEETPLRHGNPILFKELKYGAG